MIKHDMDIAKGLKRQFIRVERAEKFQKLDIDYLRALESGDTTAQAEIAAKKARLREAPAHPDINAATTIDELKAVRPPILDET
jgi:hypothetical protein